MKRKRCCDNCHEPNCGLGAEQDVRAIQISIPGVFLTCAKSQEGKSHLIKYIVHEYRDQIDYVMSISGTGSDPENLTFVPMRMRKFLWPGKKNKDFPEGETRHAVKEMIKQQMSIPKERRPICALIIEDEFDCLRDPIIHAIATRPAHYNVFLVIAVNWLNKAHPAIREGAWQIALFVIESKDGITAAYKAYGQDCYDFEKFKKILQSNTGDKKFIFKNTKGATAEEKKWKPMRAPAHIPDFIIDPSKKEEEEEETEEKEEQPKPIKRLRLFGK